MQLCHEFVWKIFGRLIESLLNWGPCPVLGLGAGVTRDARHRLTANDNVGRLAHAGPHRLLNVRYAMRRTDALEVRMEPLVVQRGEHWEAVVLSLVVQPAVEVVD